MTGATALPAVPAGPVRVALAPLAWLLTGVDWVVRRPSVLVAGTLLLVCLPSDWGAVADGGRVTLADLGAATVVLVVTVRMLAGDRSRVRRGWLPFAAVLVALALATVTASDVATSVIGFARYAELFVLVPVAVAMSLRDRLDLILIAGGIVTVTAIEGVVGVYQSLTGTGATYGGQYVRAVGTFGPDQVLALGALLGYGLLVTLALALAVRAKARIALLTAAAFAVVPLGLTLSRGAWIATAAAAGVLIVVASWRTALVLGGVVAITATVALSGASGGGFDTVGQRLTSIVSSGTSPDRSVRDRYALWHTAIAIWRDHPVLGVGLKDFAAYRDSYASISLSAGSDVGDRGSGITREPLLSAHNQYLMVLSEQGTIGIAAFGGLLVALSVGAARRKSGPPSAEQRFLDLAAPALMVWTLVDFGYGDIGAGPTSVLLAIVLGLVTRRSLVVPQPLAPR